jgi:hypothetical protein
MKGFENGTVVKELGERGVERNEKGIINSRVADVVADGGNKKRQSVKGLQYGCEYALLGGAVRLVLWVGRDGSELDQEVKHGLQDVNDMAKVVVVYEVVVRRAAGVEIHHQVVWMRLASRDAGRTFAPVDACQGLSSGICSVCSSIRRAAYRSSSSVKS